MKYAEIVDDEIIKIHGGLPESWRNISNFFALTPAQLSDLAWSGNSDARFYEFVEVRPEQAPAGFTFGPATYSIDNENHRVVGTYEIIPAVPSGPAVPPTITARQIRLWLVRHNISLEAVDAVIETIEDDQDRKTVQVDWKWAPYIERNHPMLSSLSAALGLTEEQVDRAFIEASEF